MPESCVLIVEPDLPVRHPVAEYLRGCGYKVVEAVNTDEAQTLLLSLDNVDIVLVDVSAPGTLDVFTLTRWLKERNHRAKVLLVGTHEKMAENAGKLCEEGPHLAKPYHPQQLHEEIKRLLSAHRRSNDENGKS